ncbi:MAG: RNA-directed DNA polymerase [Candidatus Gastranaerophilales bacterium]|nr:RNA-directed DNA polymerase [Candidatus Gastranaerophilales bacterium]
MPKHKGEDINDGIEQKKRIIVKPYYVYDLILQWAVIQVLLPIIMKGMYEWSCGSIARRGGVYGKKYIVKYIKRNPDKIKYAAKGDIYHFFESVDIGRLKEMFKSIIRDENMLWVINMILDCNMVEYKGKMINVGLPIGFYTSQYFANFYLQGLDHFLKEKMHIKCYVRYVDDFIMFGRNKKELHKTMFEISKYLAAIDLKLKSNHQVFRFDYIDKNGKRCGRPIDFMGFKFYRDKTTIRRKTFLKSMRKFVKVSKLKVIDVHSARQALCYKGYYKHTDSYRIFKDVVCKLVNFGNCKKIVSNYDKRKEIKNEIKLEKCRKSCRTT